MGDAILDLVVKSYENTKQLTVENNLGSNDTELIPLK